MPDSEFPSEFEHDPDVAEIEQDTWQVIDADHKAETTALGPCFGIIIYDPAFIWLDE